MQTLWQSKASTQSCSVQPFMKQPTCCGKFCKPVKKLYGKPGTYWLSADGLKWVAWSVIVGFQCKVCNRFGIPFLEPSDWDTAYMDSLEAIRQEGLAFDATLTPQPNL